MVVLRLHIFAAAAIFVGACTMEASRSGAQDSIGESGESIDSLREVSSRVNEYNGQLVTVRGYLAGYGPIMILVENQNSKQFAGSGRLLVSDTELRLEILSGDQFIDLLRYFQSLGCVDRYVEIVGGIGLIGEQETNGIVEIDSVRTYGDESFSGSGDVCYPAE